MTAAVLATRLTLAGIASNRRLSSSSSAARLPVRRSRAFVRVCPGDPGVEGSDATHPRTGVGLGLGFARGSCATMTRRFPLIRSGVVVSKNSTPPPAWRPREAASSSHARRVASHTSTPALRSWWHSLAATLATSPYTAHSHRSRDPTNPQNASPVLTPHTALSPTPRSSRAMSMAARVASEAHVLETAPVSETTNVSETPRD